MFNVITPRHRSLSELGSENLRTMLYILQSYILLEPNEFLLGAGEALSKVLSVRKEKNQEESRRFLKRDPQPNELSTC